MTYELQFHEQALAEWRKLDKTIQSAFKKKLAERLNNPRIPSARLSGMPDCYKIKLLSVGYRLIYRVEDQVVRVTVISVGKRDAMAAYSAAAKRL